jgi:uncharacterized Rossmann fold enzyme
VRVAHSSSDVELEFGVVLDLFVTDFDGKVSSYLDEGLVQEVIKNGV